VGERDGGNGRTGLERSAPGGRPRSWVGRRLHSPKWCAVLSPAEPRIAICSRDEFSKFALRTGRLEGSSTESVPTQLQQGLARDSGAFNNRGGLANLSSDEFVDIGRQRLTVGPDHITDRECHHLNVSTD